MRALQERAEALARAAQKRRLERVSQEWRELGLRVTADTDSVTIEASGLGRRRLSDLRFVGVSR